MFIFRPRIKAIAIALTAGFLGSLGSYKLLETATNKESIFPMCWRSQKKDLSEISFKGLDFVENKIAYGDISLTEGFNSENAVTVNVNQIACSPSEDICYGIIGHNQLVQLDPKSNWQTTPIEITSELPKLSWPTGITFDTDRDLLLISSLGGEGYLYSYAFDRNVWQAFSLNNIDLAAIVYHPHDKQIYALGVTYGQVKGLILYRLSLNGQILETTKLSDPILAGLPAFHESTLKPQLISSGKDLILVAGKQTLYSNGTSNKFNKSKIYTIDPENKQVKLRSKQSN
ncbi:MAG: hypothetical protein ACFBSE_07260 [Prochloraceae cyanobacterium]